MSDAPQPPDWSTGWIAAGEPRPEPRPLNHVIGDIVEQVRPLAKQDSRWLQVARKLLEAGAQAAEIEKESGNSGG